MLSNVQDFDKAIKEYADPIINHIRIEYKEMEEDYNQLKKEHEFMKVKLEVFERLAKLLELQKGIE